ncbi:helicase SNF, partial [Clostridium perfringens]
AELLRGFRASPSSVKLDPGHGKPRPFVISDDPLPVKYRFDRAEDGGYRLDVEGLADLKILESYGLVLADGILRNLQVDRCRRLRELKNMLEASRRNHIHIAAEQMEPFMQRVLPGLQRMGSVQIADAITERMVRSPLKA